MTSTADAITSECKDLSRNCLYTSTSLFIWLRFLRWTRVGFLALPLILGAIAGLKILTESKGETARVLVALAAFGAGVLPTIYAALKLDVHLPEVARLAGEFKNLQDRFRQAATVASTKPIEEFEAEFRALMDRLEAARAASYTAPEWCFRRAKKKVQSGHYDPDPQP